MQGNQALTHGIANALDKPSFLPFHDPRRRLSVDARVDSDLASLSHLSSRSVIFKLKVYPYASGFERYFVVNLACFRVNCGLARPKRGRELDRTDFDFLKEVRLRDGTCTWSDLKKRARFGQATIASEELRLVPRGLISTQRAGRRKLYKIMEEGQRCLAQREPHKTWEATEFVVTDGERLAKVELDAHGHSLSNPLMIVNLYSSPYSEEVAFDAFNLIRQLHMEAGKPIASGPVSAEIRVRVYFSEIPPAVGAWGLRLWRNRPVFPPKGTARWMKSLHSLLVESRHAEEMIKVLEREGLGGKLSDQAILVGFRKLTSVWGGTYDRLKLRRGIRRLRGVNPTREEVRFWLIFFDTLDTSYERSKESLIPERLSKQSFYLAEAYAQAKREHPHARDSDTVLQRLMRWREVALQNASPP
jgi:hypothetical protein